MKAVGAFLAVVLALAPTLPARADHDADTFLRACKLTEGDPEDPCLFSLSGIHEGYLFVNAFLKIKRHEPELYCEPDALALTGAQLRDMLRAFVKKHPERSDLPIGVVVYLTMLDAFPCQN